MAEHLQSLGLEGGTGIAHTGVVGLLKTGKPGPTIALRADMDALPVVERTDVPFKSVANSNYRGEEVGVMHAWSSLHTGEIGYRSGPLLADSHAWRATITGRQAHGSAPWFSASSA